MIRLILIAFTFVCFGVMNAQGQSRDVYTISGIAVDERAPTVAEAQQQAFAAAKLIGAQQLIERLTLPQDRAAVTDLIVDQALADRIAAAVDVEEEVAGAGRYRGSLAVVYNPTQVRAVFRQVGMPYTDSTGPKAVLTPANHRHPTPGGPTFAPLPRYRRPGEIGPLPGQAA